MKLLMLIADGLEECEALMTRDVLLRGGANVVLASINEKDNVEGQSGIKFNVDQNHLNNYVEFDGIILPGGGKGTQNLDNFKMMDELLNYFDKSNKLISAICAAPSILGKRGYLDNKEFTCFLGFEKYSEKGIYKSDEGVVSAKNIITAKSVGWSVEFAIEILKYFYKRNIISKDPVQTFEEVKNFATHYNLNK